MKTVKKALAILNSFTRDVPNQGVTEIANRLGMTKSTVHALLKALREEGYVIYDPSTKRYFLGYKPLDLAGRIQYGRDLRDLSRPVMERLSKKIEEDIALNIVAEGRRICTALVESRYFVRQLVPIGKALPLHCSAAGKVLMAYLPSDEVEEIIRRHGLPRFTPRTIIHRERLLAELADIREKGYGESREEFGKDAAAVAFPVFDAKGQILACLSIQSTVNRLNDQTRGKFIREGLLAGKQISDLLLTF
jgi:IclR family KDG regulon transcriptional repressor